MGLPAAGQVQRRAVVNRGADDGQPEGDVDGAAEAQMLEHRQPLIVIHGQHRVDPRDLLGHEGGVRRQRSAQV
jgi:hypothetical protein